MTIQKACTVTAGSASNITLGPVNTTATNTSASNTISINCSKTTPYFIGLAPSAANGGTTTGSGPCPLWLTLPPIPIKCPIS
ncbi:spore coat U domain-containing protein [Citrobacter freundii]|nr:MULTISPECIES: spore coat protein U domain-containing protein [Citrobacter]MDH0387635.1 spore coat U domain-containing protein [Citrobacter freundii]MDH0751937.1 spore coat U domain-containing protein [Citrobacter freundii]MDH1028602.1 spore coat U domain-containing protein [Citrobacter freundii]MDH1926680.1 spore coat U domain-containing protein [Citrobacter freundii]MDM3135293.1 spore coat U domain-containing protein [Citrobacter sp. Cf123]